MSPLARFAFSCVLLLTPILLFGEDPIEELTLRLRELHAQTEREQTELRSLKKKSSQLRGEIAAVEKKVAQLMKREEELIKELDAIAAELIVVEEDIRDLKERDARLRNVQHERLRALANTEPTDLLLALTTQSEVSSDSDLLTLLVEAQRFENQLIEDMDSVRDELALRIKNEEALFNKRTVAHTDIRDERSALADQLKKKGDLQRALSNEKENVQQKILRIQGEALRLEGVKQELFALSRGEDSELRGRARETADQSAVSGKLFVKGRLAWPVSGEILKRFNERSKSIGMKSGILFTAPQGSTVRPVGEGVVNFIGKIPFYGQSVVLGHGPGEYSLYGKLSEVLVKVRDKVNSDSEIGVLSDQSEQKGAQLYLELRRGSTSINPEPLLRKSASK